MTAALSRGPGRPAAILPPAELEALDALSDSSDCDAEDPSFSQDPPRLLLWLQEALRRGQVDSVLEGRFPRKVWGWVVAVGGKRLLFEARLSNHVSGLYKGYFIGLDDLAGKQARVRELLRVGGAWPLVEWMIDSWPRLVHERRLELPGSTAWPEWSGFHLLRAGRQGGALPDLRLVRFNEGEFDLRCVPDGAVLAPGLAVRFFKSAATRLAASVVERELSRFIEATLDRVGDVTTPRVARARDRWSFLRRASPEVRALGRLGSDDEGLEVGDAEAVTSALACPDASLLMDLPEWSTAGTVRAAGARPLEPSRRPRTRGARAPVADRLACCGGAPALPRRS